MILLIVDKIGEFIETESKVVIIRDWAMIPFL